MMITDSNVALYNEGQFPQIRVTVRAGEQKLYSIDDRRKTMKKVQAILDGGKDEEQDEKILEVVLGKPAAREICDSDISIKDFQHLVKTIMAIITGETVEQLEANAKN